MNTTTNGPRITAEHIAAVMDALSGSCAKGPRDALTKAGLAQMKGLSARVVEATIEVIRRDSIALVSSGPDGYWLPATVDEAEANVGRRYARVRHMLETLEGEQRLIRRLRDAEAPPRPTLWPAEAVA